MSRRVDDDDEDDDLEGVTFKGFILGFVAGMMVTLACVVAGLSHVMHAESDARGDPPKGYVR